MARMEMDCILSLTPVLENSLDIFLLVFCKYFVYDKGTWFWFEAVLTKKLKSPWQTSFKNTFFLLISIQRAEIILGIQVCVIFH